MRAEMLKVEHGSACLDEAVKGQTLTITNDFNLPLKTVNLEHLRRIMSLRIEEIFHLIEQDLSRAGLLDYLRAGVIIAGGGSRIPQIQDVAERVFQMPTALGKANSINGIKSALDQPEFATAIGLVKFGSLQSRKKAPNPLGRLTQTFSTMFKRN